MRKSEVDSAVQGVQMEIHNFRAFREHRRRWQCKCFTQHFWPEVSNINKQTIEIFRTRSFSAHTHTHTHGLWLATRHRWRWITKKNWPNDHIHNFSCWYPKRSVGTAVRRYTQIRLIYANMNIILIYNIVPVQTHTHNMQQDTAWDVYSVIVIY